MAKLLSGTLPQLKVGISSFSESKVSLSVVGISSLQAISVGGTTGGAGQYLQSTGSGLAWASASSLRRENTYTATQGQTTVNQPYSVGLIDVFVNGVRLHSSEYNASNGTSIVFNEAMYGGESIDVISYTESGSVAVDPGGNITETDTLETVTSRNGDTNNDINVGILSAKGGIFADVIRRHSDNSTSTKITLESGRLKLFAGNGVTPKVNINGGVGISTNLNVTGISTFNSSIHVGVITGANPGTTIQFGDPVDLQKEVSFGRSVDIPLGILSVGSGNSSVVVGSATTQLIVNGDARITGILTIGSSSITLDGSSNTITATTFDGNATSATTADSATSATTANTATTATSAGYATSIKVGSSAVVGFDTSGFNGNAIEFQTDNGSNVDSRWRITSAGHLIPSSNDTYDIGSAEYKVRDFYLSDSSLHTESGKSLQFFDGVLTWGGEPVILVSALKDILSESTSFKDFKKRISSL